MNKIIINEIPFTIDSLMEQYVSANSETTPYGISMINANSMWKQNITGKNVVIAVIDTGCETSHIDLKTQIIGGRNFTTEDNGNVNKYEDYNGHGTHVCGTIAAAKNNSGLLGVAPGAKLLILKVLEKDGSGDLGSVVAAIKYAIQQKVDIISMSLGSGEDVPVLHQAVKEAIDNNILVVCAAGNEGDNNYRTDEFSYPAGYNEVISVGAVDNRKSTTSFTDSNKEVDLVAPGVGIISTYIGGKYASLSGTSMATPHVTGALALLIEWSTKEFGRRLTEAELYGQLIKNTNTLTSARTLQGNGILYLNPITLTK